MVFRIPQPVGVVPERRIELYGQLEIRDRYVKLGRGYYGLVVEQYFMAKAFESLGYLLGWRKTHIDYLADGLAE